jgi:uncharacterized protein YgbK (DUF1537 family)
MKALIILNPASGKKTAEPIKESINTQLKDSQIEFEIYETKKEDNIGDIVRALLKNKLDLVVAAGGDGTVSAVINGVVGTAIPWALSLLEKEDYLPGFTWHLHRGMETITYLLKGEVDHGDNMDNRGCN